MPIGIAKSYSRDSIGNSCSHDHEDTSRSSVGIANDDAGTSFSPEEMSGSPTWEEDVCEEENTVSYAFKYTGGPTNNATKQTEHASKVVKQVDSYDARSPSSAKLGGESVSDASSYVSETTDCDVFNSLLLASESEESGSDPEDYEEGPYGGYSTLDKENANSVNNNSATSSSSSAHLLFKSTTLIKPAEINQHEERAPLSPVPMQARKWRTMAAEVPECKISQREELEGNIWRELIDV